MPNWLAKAAAQKALSLLPGSRTWNHLLQTYVTHSLDLDRPQGAHATRFAAKLAQCRRHIEHYRAYAPTPNSFTALELGTGWRPIVPVGLFLCGADQVWTVDQQPMLTTARVRETLARIVAAAQSPEWQHTLPAASADRLATLEQALASDAQSPQALLERLHIQPLTTDARRLPLPAASICLIVSNNTLEHIPQPMLNGVFQEFRRLSTPHAVMSHFIDMADHYIHFDATVSPYNFLRFSTRTWSAINHSLQYLNRRRISDDRALHQAAGFTIMHEESDSSVAPLLVETPLAAEFRSYTHADLAVTSSWIVSTPMGDASCNS